MKHFSERTMGTQPLREAEADQVAGGCVLDPRGGGSCPPYPHVPVVSIFDPPQRFHAPSLAIGSQSRGTRSHAGWKLV